MMSSLPRQKAWRGRGPEMQPVTMRLSAGGGSHPSLPDPCGGPYTGTTTRDRPEARQQAAVTERRRARVSPVAGRCAPVSSRDGAG